MKTLALLFLASTAVYADKPTIATVTAGSPVTINSTAMPATNAPTSPLVDQDEVAATTDPAVIVFPDGSRFTLAKGSRVKVSHGGPCAVTLLQGSVAYKTPEGVNVRICAADRLIKPQPATEGTVVLNEAGDKVLVQVPNPNTVEIAHHGAGIGKKAVAAIVAGGAGTAVATTALVKKDKPKSKSKND